MHYLTITALILTGCLCVPALAGTYADLEPGVSTRSDALKALGKPVREIIRDQRYEYAPDNNETGRISIVFYADNSVIRAIDIYPTAGYQKAQYQTWFELKAPDSRSFDAEGSLVEAYQPQGIELHYAGTDDTATVRFFRHYDRSDKTAVVVDPPREVPPVNKNPDLVQLLARIEALEEEKDWETMKSLVDDGLARYPGCAELWYANARYHFEVPVLSGKRRDGEILRSVTRAYDLEPTAKRAMDLGWIHLELFDACAPALYYFEKAAIEKASERPDLYYWMGVCSEETDQPDNAAKYYARFLDAAPGHKKAEDARWRMDALMHRFRD